MKKSDRDITTAQIVQAIATGKTKHAILYKLAAEGFSKHMAINLYEESVAKIRVQYHADKEQNRDLITHKLEQLYQESYEAKKHGVCVSILREIAELQGLKTTNINVTGEVSEATATTLIEQLNCIMITVDKGIEHVLDQSIAAAIGIPDQSQSSDSGSV